MNSENQRDSDRPWRLCLAAMLVAITFFGVIGATAEAQPVPAETASSVELSAAAPAVPPAPLLWEPAPRPSMCLGIEANVLLLDVSGSMVTKRLFKPAVEQIGRFIDQSPPCSYVVLARFGTTADVVGHSFLTTAEDRELLKRSLGAIQANHQRTHFDEAAKLIEWLELKMAKAYGEGMFTLAVRVITDEESSPAPDKEAFSLSAFFDERAATGRMKVLTITLRKSGSEVPIVPVEPVYAAVSAPVDKLGETLRQAVKPQLPAPPPLKVADAAEVTPVPIDKELARSDGVFAADVWLPAALWVLAAVLLSGLAIWIKRSLREPLGAPAEGPATGTRGDLSAAFLVTERERGDDGRSVTVLQDEVHLPIASGATVTFGTDPQRCTYVISPIEKAARGGELFQLTPLPEGGVRVTTSEKDLRCNEQVIPRKGLTIPAGELRLHMDTREWLITTSTQTAPRRAVADLFTRLEAAQRGRANQT